MKFLKLCIVLVCGFSFFSFGQGTEEKNSDLYEFTPTTPVALVTETEKKPVEEEKPEQDAGLVADAQTLIRDKLIQKYQVRLDEVLDRLTTKLWTVSADEQRKALTQLRTTVADRKALVLARKDLDPNKRDIIIAILDHVIYRVDGLIKQSATQTDTQKIKA